MHGPILKASKIHVQHPARPTGTPTAKRSFSGAWPRQPKSRSYHPVVAVCLLVACCTCAAASRKTPVPLTPVSISQPATLDRARQAVIHLWPASYQATQRAVVTVRRRQYVLDGVLKASPAEGLHLALISSLGLVTDLRRTPDGRTEILKTTALFPEAWARDYVGSTLDCLFAPPDQDSLIEAGHLATGQRVLVTTRGVRQIRYHYSATHEQIEALEVLEKGRLVASARFEDFQQTEGSHTKVPSRISIDTRRYQILLRNVRFRISAPAAMPSSKEPATQGR